jgi:hypothetical protein
VESHYAILQDTGNNTGSLYKDAEWVSINCNENMRYRQHKKATKVYTNPCLAFVRRHLVQLLDEKVCRNGIYGLIAHTIS